jgi:hypothetical protein
MFSNNQIVFDWACMPTVYCYPVKLTIADLIRAKSICSQTQFSHVINRLLTSLVRSVLWNIKPLFFAWTSLLRRSVHTKKPQSDISQYRPHTRSISRYWYFPTVIVYTVLWVAALWHVCVKLLYILNETAGKFRY